MHMTDDLRRSWELAEHGHRARVVSLSLLLWDYVLTFEEERKLFWNKPKSSGTYLFFWNRYIGVLIAIFGAIVLAVPEYTETLCRSWLRIEGWLGITSCWSVEVILQVRIYALYDRSKLVATIMGTLFIIQVLFIMNILAFATNHGTVIPEMTGYLRRCKVIDIPDWMWLLWVALTSFELLLCALTLNKGIQVYRGICHIPSSSHFPTIQTVILRDAIIYCFLIGIIYTANLISWIIGLPDTLDFLTGMAIAFPSVMCSRLMINVRAHSADWLHSNPGPNGVGSHDHAFHPSEISLTIPRMSRPPPLGCPFSSGNGNGGAADTSRSESPSCGHRRASARTRRSRSCRAYHTSSFLSPIADESESASTIIPTSP